MLAFNADEIHDGPLIKSHFDLARRIFRVNLSLIQTNEIKSLFYAENKDGNGLIAGYRGEEKSLKLPIMQQGHVVAYLKCEEIHDDGVVPFEDRPQVASLNLRQIRIPVEMSETGKQNDLMLFLEMMVVYLSNCEELKKWTDNPEDNNVFWRAVTYIDKNLPEAISSFDIAKAAGVSTRTLARYFQRELKTSPMDFVISRRVKKACDHLTHTNSSCIEIAYAVGFQSVQSFNRMFRKYKSTTPRAWRQKAMSIT